MRQTITYLALMAALFPAIIRAQETNSHARGKVYAEANQGITGASVTVIHEPTKNRHGTISEKDGQFRFFNLKPGGPYTLSVSAIGYQTLTVHNLFIQLAGEHFYRDNAELTELQLTSNTMTLDTIEIASVRTDRTQAGIQTRITADRIGLMPSISRGFQDYIRIVPQSRVTGEGSISLAGQNNRFNAFFVDGSSIRDLQGLAVNGTNGGLTGSPPVSIEAIEEVNVMLAPYHAQYGQFTGGSIHAITKSGSQQNKSAAWYFFRNENMAGRSPQAVEKPGSTGEYHYPMLSDFFNQTFGVWNSGALVKNKLFYFALIEYQKESRPQPYDFSEYQGAAGLQHVQELADYIESTYRYNPGPFLESKDELEALRLNVKLDWNASLRDKFMLGYRLNDASRSTMPRPSGSTSIAFQHSGVIIPATTHGASFEWKHYSGNQTNNRLLLSFTSQADDRQRMSTPFPYVTILDGKGNISFGSEANSGMYGFKAYDFSVFDAFNFVHEKHQWTVGFDASYHHLDNQAVQSYFGSYTYRNLDDFMQQRPPSRLQRFFPLNEGADESVQIRALRTSFFLNDEIQFNERVKLSIGVRMDFQSVLNDPPTDPFFNDSALSAISAYYDLEGARSGQVMAPDLSASPRASLEYILPGQRMKFKLGAGIFKGQIIPLWIFDLFNTQNGGYDIIPQQFGLDFNPDPYSQPTPASLNLDPGAQRGNMNLVASRFKYPSVFRTSFAGEKKLAGHWTIAVEGLYTLNLRETVFQNVNILPPVTRSNAPGSRNIYSFNSSPAKIPVKSNGSNPYEQIILMTNNHEKKGQAYSLSVILSRQKGSFSFNSSYTFGRSFLLFEVTGPQTPMFSQWRNLETADGRNFPQLSRSDNDVQHRLTAWVSQAIAWGKGKTTTEISLFYNGQSGTPYSYVNNGSMVNDLNNRERFDLIYVPTKDELAVMSFLPVKKPSGEVLYTPEEQKSMFDAYIESDDYLRGRRGSFAERNGTRLPFTHILDLRIQQHVRIRTRGGAVGMTLVWDIFNLANLVNRSWGRVYSMNLDNFPLLRFAGYASTSPAVPQYQFEPVKGTPYAVQTSTIPGNSARWLSQLGLRIQVD